MLIKVTTAKYLHDYKLELTFNDGTHTIVDLKDSLNGLVFEPLNKLYLSLLKT